MSETSFREYLTPAATYIGGAAITAFAGGAAAVGIYLAALGSNRLASILQKNADARDAAREFALNDVLARAFGRAAGSLAKQVAAEAAKAKDKGAKKALNQLGNKFVDLWVDQMRKRYSTELDGMDAQELALVFSEGLVMGEGVPMSK